MTGKMKSRKMLIRVLERDAVICRSLCCTGLIPVFSLYKTSNSNSFCVKLLIMISIGWH